MTDELRVYVDGRGVLVPPASTALDAVRAVDTRLASEITGGERLITDSRGIPIDADAPAFYGAIFRVVRARARDEE